MTARIVRDKRKEPGESRLIQKNFRVTPSENALLAAAADYGFPLAVIARHGLAVLLTDPEYGAKIKQAAAAIKSLQQG